MTERDVETVRVRALRTELAGTVLHFSSNPSLLPRRPATVFNPQLQEGALCWAAMRLVALSTMAALAAALIN